MFSIWTKGMADLLNLMPGGPTARLASLEGVGKYEHLQGQILWSHVLAKGYAIFQSIEEVVTGQPFAQDTLNPCSSLVGSSRSILVEAQFAQVFIQGGYRGHDDDGRRFGRSRLVVQYIARYTYQGRVES